MNSSHSFSLNDRTAPDLFFESRTSIVCVVVSRTSTQPRLALDELFFQLEDKPLDIIATHHICGRRQTSGEVLSYARPIAASATAVRVYIASTLRGTSAHRKKWRMGDRCSCEGLDGEPVGMLATYSLTAACGSRAVQPHLLARRVVRNSSSSVLSRAIFSISANRSRHSSMISESSWYRASPS